MKDCRTRMQQALVDSYQVFTTYQQASSSIPTLDSGYESMNANTEGSEQYPLPKDPGIPTDESFFQDFVLYDAYLESNWDSVNLPEALPS